MEGGQSSTAPTLEKPKLEGEELRDFLWGKIKEGFAQDNGRDPTIEEEYAMRKRLSEKIGVPVEDESIFFGKLTLDDDEELELDEALNMDDEFIQEMRTALEGSEEQMKALDAAAAMAPKSEEQFEALREILLGFTDEQRKALTGEDSDDDDSASSEDEAYYDEDGDEDTDGDDGGVKNAAAKAAARAAARGRVKKTKGNAASGKHFKGGRKVVFKKKQPNSSQPADAGQGGK
jgi:hypothetical protein